MLLFRLAGTKTTAAMTITASAVATAVVIAPQKSTSAALAPAASPNSLAGTAF